MSFYPQDARVPVELRTQEFLLRPLRATDVELDYDALMESKEMLRQWGQGSWPRDDFTLAENLKDLERHERDHLERKAFTFTVMDLTETKCLGCVYIQPLPAELQDVCVEPAEEDSYGAWIWFWVRQSRLEDDLDKRLLEALTDWFEREWSFSCAVFVTGKHNERQVELMREAGLQFRREVESEGRSAKWVVYG